jgi:hypothetical protein
MTRMNDQWCSDQTISDLPARASTFHVQLHRGGSSPRLIIAPFLSSRSSEIANANVTPAATPDRHALGRGRYRALTWIISLGSFTDGNRRPHHVAVTTSTLGCL